MISSDEDALSSVFTGTWTGSNQVTVFEGLGGYDKARKVKMQAAKLLHCELLVDMDKRSAELRVNGVKSKILFSESMTSVNYIGYGVKGAGTKFSAVKIDH